MYLGWDIGIKNLAFCNIIPVTDEIRQTLTEEDKNNLITIGKYTFHIKNWDVINLVDKVQSNMIEGGMLTLAGRPNLTCYYPKNAKGKLCGKSTTYCLEKKEEDKYKGLCGNHFKRLGYTRLPTTDTKPKCYYSIDKGNGKFEYCTKYTQFMLSDHYYIGYCKEHQKILIKEKKKTENDFLKVGKSKKASHINLTNLGLALFQQLDTKPELLNVKIVLLENQPVLKNPTMKSVQMLLYSYFIMKGIKERKDELNLMNEKPIEEIKCYSASNKTNLIKYMPEKAQTEITDKVKNLKGKYAKNKKTAILLVTELVKDKPKWESFFNTHKKKDDLADALLMTLYYCS